MHKKMILGRTR